MEHGTQSQFEKEDGITGDPRGSKLSLVSRGSVASQTSQKPGKFQQSKSKNFPVKTKPPQSPTKQDEKERKSSTPRKYSTSGKLPKKPRENVGIPCMVKIPVMEWDRGMHDITSEEELNILKSLPTEYSGAYMKERKPSEEEEKEDSTERFKMASVQLDKRISFEPRDLKVHSASPSSLSLLSRSKSESLASQEHRNSSYIGMMPFDGSREFGKEPEGKKQRSLSRMFSKFKNLCKRRHKQSEIYRSTVSDLATAKLSEEKEPSKGTKVKFSSDEGEKTKQRKSTFQEEEEIVEEEEEEEIQYDIDPTEVKNCLRQVSRPDGVAVSGEICFGMVPCFRKDEEPTIPIKDTDDPATFLYRLGINVDKAEAMFVKNSHLNGRLHAAITEASIWTRSLTKTQAVLLLHLAEKTKPNVMGWYPHLVEAIVSNRITNTKQINGYLQTLEKMSQEKAPVKRDTTFSPFTRDQNLSSMELLINHRHSADVRRSEKMQLEEFAKALSISEEPKLLQSFTDNTKSSENLEESHDEEPSSSTKRIKIKRKVSGSVYPKIRLSDADDNF